jgi:LysR family transcriptional regulator, hydrogen peroxide-inducible genes activator
MQMYQIRYFLALCDEGSFARAAKRSGVSQPSVSNAIKKLERELGGALFERRRLITLTALGNAMLPHFRRITEIADNALEIAQAFGHASPVNAEMGEQDQTAPGS